ncbi:hypothetical protein [Massilibacteroides sp.]|uniref:hypothetical protein n=1 Tax=Massilibacteroides sp. TaxID=2034766 RepID=UPI00261CA1D5|nr:hypothetical protein [Massilibacteroides sp.]MDD4515637.1 hypothetical protein [Massilibacteroides sp.]
MNLKFKILVGSTTTWLNPDYSDLKFSNQNNDGKAVFSVGGVLKLMGTDYDVFKAATTYDITCYGAGTTMFTCDETTTEVSKENISLRQIDLKITAKTEYTAAGWENYDKEYDITTITTESNDLYFLPSFITYETQTVAYTDKRLNNNTAVNANLGLSGWDISSISISFSYEDPIGSGNWYYEGNCIYLRQKGKGFYIDSVAYEPTTDSGWTYKEDEVINGVTYPIFTRPSGANTYTYNGAPEPWSSIVNSSNLYYNAPIEYTGVTRKITQVITYLIGQMGVTYSVDNSGTSTDTFYSFKSMTGESMTKNGTTSDKLYGHLLVMNLTDFVPDVDGTQKDVPASVTMVSLKTIFDFLSLRGFFWYLENRSGTYYLKVEHKSQRTFGTSNPDLNNYKGHCFSRWANLYEKDPPECRIIRNENESRSIDFVGTDAVFPDILTTDAVKEWRDNQVFVDLDDIAYRRHDVYSETDNNNIVIIAAMQTSGKDYVRNPNGIVTGAPSNNTELSWSYIARYYLCDLPDSNMTVNGGTTTAAAYRLKKRNKYKLTIPIDNIITDFDFTDYVSIFDEDTEIDQISMNAPNTIGEIILKA